MLDKDSKETTTKRVPLTPTVYEKLRSFARGADMTYDEVIEMLLRPLLKGDEDPVLAGRRAAQVTKSAS